MSAGAGLDRCWQQIDSASDERLGRLELRIFDYGPCVTAFSGGVDSTLVAVVAARVHGDRALAVTGVSPSLAADERASAQALAEGLGLAHRQIDTDELARAEYRANLGDRCYHCKTELFERLRRLARAEGFAAVLSGDNLDDLSGHRPGMKAAEEQGVRKPLVESGLGKDDIRALAALLKLPNHKKPASPCLASRIPQGTVVDSKILARIDRAETGVRRLGFSVFRVRHHGDLARLELSAEEFGRATTLRTQLIAAIRGAGYQWATLDLSGFRSGSLHVISGERK